MTYHPSFSWRLLSQWPSPHYDSRWVVCDCLRHLRYISVWAEACRPRLVISGEERLTSCNVTLQETTLSMVFTSLPFTPKLMFSVLKIMITIFYNFWRFNIFFVTRRRTEKMSELSKGKRDTVSAQKNKNCVVWRLYLTKVFVFCDSEGYIIIPETLEFIPVFFI